MSTKKNIVYCDSALEQSRAYTDYIKNHKRLVELSYLKYESLFHDTFPELFNNEYESYWLKQDIWAHDKSKYDKEEFLPYANRFFPIKGIEYDPDVVKRQFKFAWLHHIHNNKHHPQYFVLYDDDKITIFDMPDKEIIHMMCDWTAMSMQKKSSLKEYWLSNSGQSLPMTDNVKNKVDSLVEKIELTL